MQKRTVIGVSDARLACDRIRPGKFFVRIYDVMYRKYGRGTKSSRGLLPKTELVNSRR